MEKNYTFKFNSDTALSALKVGKYDPINFYEARLDLFNRVRLQNNVKIEEDALSKETATTQSTNQP